MDSPIDLEALRGKLRAMPWGEAMRLATEAGLKKSTANKFRLGIIEELGGFKVQALHNAILRKESAANQSRKKLARA